MFERRSLKWPITLGVTMIVMLVTLAVGWIVLAVSSLMRDQSFAPVYWTLLTVGTLFFILVLVGVVIYLALSIKAINLNRRQSNFIDSVTHELKSPIASLQLYLQTLNRRDVPPVEQRDFFRFMLDDVERLDQLINQLLDAARLERKASADEIELVKIDELLARCADELRVRYRVSDEQVKVQAEPVAISASPVDLDMIMRNLIDNALKYGGEPPQVEIEAQLNEHEQVRIRVSDNGPGVPPRYRHKIFSRFVRLGDELERQKTGTGLGLYIVQTLVHRLRGRIRVRDREAGPGSVFEITLPGERYEPAAVEVECDSKATAAGAEVA